MSTRLKKDKRGRFVKGYTPWNRGKHLSEKTRKKMSKSRKGVFRSRVVEYCKSCGKEFSVMKSRVGKITTCSKRCSTEWRIKNYKPPRRGQSLEVKCKYCGKMFRTKMALYQNGGGKFCSRNCHSAYVRSHPELYGGPNHWNWKGGISGGNHQLRRNKEYIEWRDAVYRRDNWTCQECGHKRHEIVAHHIKDFKEHPELRYDVNNGITLCRACHKRLHYNIGEETQFKKGQLW